MRQYVLTDGTHYLRQTLNRRFEETRNITIAEVYSSEYTAYQTLKVMVPRCMKDSYYVGLVTKSGAVVEVSRLPVPKERPDGARCPALNEIEVVEEWLQRIDDEGLETLQKTAAETALRASIKVSEMDKARNDLLHWMEDNRDLNHSDAYVFRWMLGKVALCRRRAKTVLKINRIINESKRRHRKPEAVKADISRLKESCYKPRVIGELFSGGISDGAMWVKTHCEV